MLKIGSQLTFHCDCLFQPPFDVNLILNLKQTNQPITNARLIAQQQQSQQRSSDTPGSADISPRGPAGYPSVELIKRGDVIDLDTLIATQLQHKLVLVSNFFCVG